MPQFSFSLLFRVLSRTVLLAGTAVAFLACGNGEGQQANEMEAGEAASADTEDTTVVAVTMTDHAYQPSNIRVPAGEPVTLEFENTGGLEHYFVAGDTIASDGDGFRENLFRDVSIEKSKQTEGDDQEDAEDDEHEEEDHENEFELPPGTSGSITFTLPESKAGTYTIACFETTGGTKHHEMGMTGTLTVTANAEN